MVRSRSYSPVRYAPWLALRDVARGALRREERLLAPVRVVRHCDLPLPWGKRNVLESPTRDVFEFLVGRGCLQVLKRGNRNV